MKTLQNIRQTNLKNISKIPEHLLFEYQKEILKNFQKKDIK